MKMIRAILASICLAIVCHAAPPINVQSYFTNAVITTAVFTNAGDTGLSVSNVYICIPAATLTNGEFSAVTVTNDVRGFVSAAVNRMSESIAAKATTNQFTSYQISQTVQYGATGTNRTIYRAISEQQNVTFTPSYPGE